MSYYVSNMIGIRTGGVFSDTVDLLDMESRIKEVVRRMQEGDTGPHPDIYWDSNGKIRCLSPELTAHKGSYVVIAGVFNYWTFPKVSKFAQELSREFVTEVMIMSWDEEEDDVACQIFLNGKPLFEVRENPIGKILRRVAG